jgi:hypothetical protein
MIFEIFFLNCVLWSNSSENNYFFSKNKTS